MVSLYFYAFSQPNLGKIQIKNGKKINYVAIGSSLSAGVRSGGVYEISQKTSFPSLLAQQFGISDFKIPILPENGTGKKTVTLDKKGILVFQEVKSYSDSREGDALPKITTPVDNLSIPYQKVADLFEPNDNYLSPYFDLKSFKYKDRFFETKDEEKVSVIDFINSKVGNYDFFSFEFGIGDYIQFINSGSFGTYIAYMTDREIPGEIKILDNLISKIPQGVICNVPDVLDFPIYRFYTLAKLLEATEGQEIYIEYLSRTAIRKANPQDIFLPHNSITDILNGKKTVGLSEEFPLEDKDVFSEEEISAVRIKAYNEYFLAPYAKKKNIPIVDLFGLYKKIMQKDFVTDDGVLIDPSYPNGNFFSSDGITPTALGQAVITNELIKTINAHYNSSIPLVSTKSILNF